MLDLPKKWLMLAGMALNVLVTQGVQASEPLLYTTSATRSLPGQGHSWGFAALEPTRPYLFVARRENGLAVFDVEKQSLLKTLDNSAGANALAFVPQRNRAYVANMDGSLGIVALDRLVVEQRLKLDTGNLNNLVYDASRDRIIVTSGRRGDHSTLYFIDAKTDRLVGSTDVQAQKLDGPIILSNGTFIVPMRDEDQVAMLSGAQLEQQRLLKFEGCSKPSAVVADEAHQRLFVACRGAAPILLVADLQTGKRLASLPITRAVNTLAYDAQRNQVLVPSGNDGNLTVIQGNDAGEYRALAAVSTRLWAHNMVFDAARSQVYLLSADFTQPAATKENPKPDPVFHPDTFTVMTLKAH